MANEELSGVQKAAILLITLGPEKSADIFKHLKEDEIEELTLEIANTQSVSPKLKEDVINEFYQVCLAQQYIAEGGIGYAKELLEKALGADEATRVITKLTASLQVRPFEFIRKTEPSQVLNFIHSHDLILPVTGTGIHDLGCFGSGQAGRCGKTYCDHGSYFTGSHQGSGACLGAKVIIPHQSGLHDRWRCRLYSRNLKYS